MNAMLKADNLEKSYRGKLVVAGVSLSLKKGEVLGLLGPNGAGKTTTVGMLYGAVERDGGTVEAAGYRIPEQEREARRHIGVVTQEDRLDSDFSVIENLTNYAHCYRITGHEASGRALELLRELGIESYRDYEIDALSGGLRRRIVLARALIHKPQILFLDEPTTGLDPDARQDFWTQISSFRESGLAVLLTTHYMDEAERLCDRLMLIQQGRIIDEGHPQEIILRHVGEDAVEVGGIAEPELRSIIPATAVWRPLFDGGFYVSLPGSSVHELWKTLHNLEPDNLKRRKSNLEDVFLQMTGNGLI